MNQEIRNLEPIPVWNNFSDLNAVPRASKKEERVIDFMVSFGNNLGLKTIIDQAQNVIIKKPATSGMQDRKTVVLQSHLDMVHQKNSDTIFDFNNEGIKMIIDGEWITADGTTLGADNGLGVAAIMSILESTNIPHPAIEALFTIDEETGMTGAMGLQAGYLDGEILLNLDTEEDDEIDIGCAGGIDVTASKEYQQKELIGNYKAYKVSITGLLGGHSGMDIHKGLGNSNKIMNQILKSVENLILINNINGGSLRNAIPRESFTTIVTKEENSAKLLEKIEEISNSIILDFSNIEPNLDIQIKSINCPSIAMDKKEQSELISAIENAFNGVYKMSEAMPDLVEASNNIAKVSVDNGLIKIECLARSSNDNTKKEVTDLLQSVFERNNFKVILSGSYPGWQPNTNSQILQTLKSIYVSSFKQEPKIVACHAGLECGILGINYPNMDMISFGPTIHGAHSPDEKVNIASTQKFWFFLKEILKNIPFKE